MTNTEGSDIAPWRTVWAKAPHPEPGQPRMWSPLHTHLTDTGAVARLIWDEWLGEPARAVVRADAQGDDTVAREIAALAGAVHDIGKCSRAFAGQVGEMKVEMMHRGGFTWPATAIEQDSRRLPHALAGQVIIERFLQSRGVPITHARALGVVVGGHHGVPPTEGELVAAQNNSTFLGMNEWETARSALLDHVVNTLDLTAAIDGLRTVRLSDASQMLLTAVVIMADWIASNADYFPLVRAWQDSAEDPNVRARRGWDALALPRPWRPTAESRTADVTTLLRSRFGVDFEANEVQRLAVEAAREMPEPGLLLIEAVMGVGKTEASLLAAEVLAARFGASGVFYALPTRATADAMFLRVLQWWERVPGEDDGDRGIALRHGTASLSDAYRGLPRRRPSGEPRSAEHVLDDAPLAAGDLVDVGRDVAAPTWSGRHAVSGSAVAHHWTSGRKQASFADSVVATIDHELLAALASRHVVLRHLGLTRQVVVLDEIHAADTWMFAYLERALEWLARYGVPVIAMSATLAPHQRQQLVEAYERGRRRRAAALAPRPATTGLLQARAPAEPSPVVPASDEYPLLTVLSRGQVTQRSAAWGAERPVRVEWLTGDATTELTDLERAIEPVVAAGGCVLVVRNTVRRAVETYRALRASWGEKVSLSHSRFVAFDRLRNDDQLRERFGKGDGDRAGRVVVATQVAEQSLDVDFDLLVTDLAPIDLVLQRIGRLQRHPERVRPVAIGSPARCLVTGIDLSAGSEGPPVLDRGSTRVYGAFHLWRSAALLREYTDAGRDLQLPQDVPVLVRRCYSAEPVGPESWQSALRDAEVVRQQEDARAASGAQAYRLRAPGERGTLLGLLAVDAGEAETNAGVAKQVRETDGGFEVIVLIQGDDGLRLLPQFGDARRIPEDTVPAPDLVRLLARSIVRVPGWVTGNPGWVNQVLASLERNYYPTWQKQSVLSGQLVLLLKPDGTGTMGPFSVSYDTELGLSVEVGVSDD